MKLLNRDVHAASPAGRGCVEKKVSIFHLIKAKRTLVVAPWMPRVGATFKTVR